MADYIWELGIDWDLRVSDRNVSYLSEAFVMQGTAPLVKRPLVHSGDTIAFKIFDVTKGSQEDQKVAKIESFTINAQAGVPNQSSIDPLSSLQPPVTFIGRKESTFFGTSPDDRFPCWEAQVLVTELNPQADEKFQLSFFVQARGVQDPVGPRSFIHDPEMVVGPNT